MLNELIKPEWIVLAAATMFILGYLIINQVLLRVILLVGTGLYIWYYLVAADAPLWEAVFTSIATGTANLIGLCSLWWRSSRLAIPAEHLDLYSHFQGLPPGDFRDLVRRARRRRIAEPTDVTTEGAALGQLIYVISGHVHVQKRGEAFSMPAQIFVGEVAYMTHQPSAATTHLSPGAEILEWDVADLRIRSARKARFKLALEAMISSDLSRKVAHAVAPQSGPWRSEITGQMTQA
ncbi:MAG: cyclic nucleotide-binding domain-containing protein [Pseudomonadota bacterium]